MSTPLKTSLRLLLVLMLSIAFCNVKAQKKQHGLPYKKIPAYPSNYTPGNILKRYVDGLGYRYYWATEGLTEKDLDYSPAVGARTTMETLQHIFGLSETIVNAPTSTPNIGSQDLSAISFEELRRRTLQNFKKASELFEGKTANEIKGFKVIFESPDYSNEFPFWNMINGPMSDALYHIGQVVLLRRSSGNPINPKVNVFEGKTGE